MGRGEQTGTGEKEKKRGGDLRQGEGQGKRREKMGEEGSIVDLGQLIVHFGVQRETRDAARRVGSSATADTC